MHFAGIYTKHFNSTSRCFYTFYTVQLLFVVYSLGYLFIFNITVSDTKHWLLKYTIALYVYLTLNAPSCYLTLHCYAI